MSIHRNPRIVTEGLVFGYDADDRSNYYKGEPTTNLFTNSYFSNGTIGWAFGSWTSTSYTYEVVNCDLPNFKNALKINRIAAGGSADFHQGDKYKQTTVYTISAYVRGVGIFSLSSQWGSGKTFTLKSEWQRISFTTTSSSTNGQYFFYKASGIENWMEITGCQIEEKSHVTPFVNDIRSATQSLIDLKKTTTIDLSNVSFDSTAHPIWISTDTNSITAELLNINPTSLTVETVFMPTNPGGWQCVVHRADGATIGSSEFWIGLNTSNNYITGTIGAKTGVPNTYDAGKTDVIGLANKYYHIITTWDGSKVDIYINNVLKKTYSLITYSNSTDQTLRFGAANDIGNTYSFNGKIPIVKIYWNKSFTSNDVEQNFLTYKNRFNLI